MAVSPGAQLVQRWGKAFQKGDLCLLEKLLHKDYSYVYYPKSIHMKTLTKEEFIEVLHTMIPTWVDSVVGYLCC